MSGFVWRAQPTGFILRGPSIAERKKSLDAGFHAG